MALINCPECGNEVSKGARTCPRCGHPLKKEKRKHGCLFTILGIIIFFGGISYIFLGVIGEDKLIQKSISGVSDDNEYITMDEYSEIKTGMSYEEVKEIVGSAGELSSEVEANGIKVIIITWYGNGVAGSSANVTFTNNEVTAKAQVGLK